MFNMSLLLGAFFIEGDKDFKKQSFLMISQVPRCFHIYPNGWRPRGLNHNSLSLIFITC